MVSMSARKGYSSTTSTTSRPLYLPHFGQTRCGSLGSRPERRGSMNREHGAGRCGAWNVFVLDSARCSLTIQLFERRPAVVYRFRLAVALDLIPVLPALRADSLAIL